MVHTVVKQNHLLSLSRYATGDVGNRIVNGRREIMSG